MENKFYHISRRSIRDGATLTQGIYGERVIDQKTVDAKYELYIKEKMFEDIRALEFPNLPSRLNCVFLYNNLEIAKFHWAYEYSYQAYIYEVEIVKGEPFVAEMDLLNCNKMRYTQIKNNAEKYWSQVYHPDSCTLECLLDGEAKVKELVEGPSKIW
jgi:hypothetical protein